MNLELLAASVRSIPDYPKAGILFRDVTTLVGDGPAFAFAVQQLAARWREERVEAVAGLEARGFIFGGAVAAALGVGFVPIRKKGKLPHQTLHEEYALEYGTDVLEMHVDAVKRGARVVVIDDLIATGGTALAALRLLRRAGAQVIGAGFVIDLPDLSGAAKLDVPVHALLSFPGH